MSNFDDVNRVLKKELGWEHIFRLASDSTRDLMALSNSPTLGLIALDGDPISIDPKTHDLCGFPCVACGTDIEFVCSIQRSRELDGGVSFICYDCANKIVKDKLGVTLQRNASRITPDPYDEEARKTARLEAYNVPQSRVDELLNTRDKTHGSFIVNSRVSQGLKDVVRAEPTYKALAPIHREALDHIFGKIGRIMAGQPEFDDHWDDISGYGRLPVKFKHGRKE